jgi:hypothetical protein
MDAFLDWRTMTAVSRARVAVDARRGKARERESAKVARRLITETCRRGRVDRDQATIHAERGGPIIAGTVAELLNDLGVNKVAFPAPGVQ